MKTIKTLFVYMYSCRKEFLKLWAFFFILSLVGKTPYSTLYLLSLSFSFSIIVLLVAMLVGKHFK